MTRNDPIEKTLFTMHRQTKQRQTHEQVKDDRVRALHHYRAIDV